MMTKLVTVGIYSIAVRVRRRRRTRGHDTAATRLVDDQDLLSPVAAELLGNKSGNHVGTAASRALSDDLHRLSWVILRPGDRTKREHG